MSDETHDQLCPGRTGLPVDDCQCELIKHVRSDECEWMVREGWVGPEAYKANVKILRESIADVMMRVLTADDLNGMLLRLDCNSAARAAVRWCASIARGVDS